MSLQDIGAKVLSVKSSRWLDEKNTQIEVLVELSIWEGEHLHFTVDANYDTTHGKEIWEGLMSGEYGKIDPYQPPSKEELEEHENMERVMLYNKEKGIAMKIEEDYRLEIEEISDEEFKEVKIYIKSIKPDNPNKISIKRPEIFKRYE